MRYPSVAASTFLVAVALASCGIADAQTGGSDRTGDTGAVATSGASAGAERANDRRESGGKPFKVTPMGTFNEPWAMTFLPGSSDLLITEKPGRLLLRGANGRAIPVSGVPAVSYGGQGGLGDVVLHPNFRSNSLVYLSWVEAGPAARAPSSVAASSSARATRRGWTAFRRSGGNRPRSAATVISATASPSAPTA
jgi:glucose/arabinose dehydrogenase